MERKIVLHGGVQTLGIALVLWLGLPAGLLSATHPLRAQNRPGDWAVANHNYAAWNYSPLDQINTQNVQNLRVAWTFATGVTDSHEAQPLVIGNTMYIVTPKPNRVFALDLTQQGLIKWEFRPEFNDLERTISRACCGAQTRGLAYSDGKIFFNTLDGQLFALIADNGQVLWRTQVGNLDISETMTAAPLVVKGNVIVGVAGGERGVRGWVAAYDIATGERKWRRYSMGPNEDVGIGPRFRPFYASDRIENPALDTWYSDSWKRGGGTVWGWWAYDPELNLFYHGTGNCGPWNPDYRRAPSDLAGLEGAQIEKYANKYCSSLMARDADTGELIWVSQLTPQDQWDLDEPGQIILIDLEIEGQMRRALVKAARNGFFYVFDRATGELLREPVMHTKINWATGFDLRAGRPLVNPEKIMRTDIVNHVCPIIHTADWENHAYSPRTGLVYFASSNLCQDMTMIEGQYVPGESYSLVRYRGEGVPGLEGPHRGELQAWNPATGKKVWGITSTSVENRKPVMATAGDLVFQGTDEGAFRAIDGRTGKVLWTFRTGTDFRNAPISYLGPDGKQYVAVISSRAPSDPAVAADAPPDAASRLRRSGTILYVFSLP